MRLIFLALAFFCAFPAWAAEPVFERFTGPSPAMLLAERSGDPAAATAFAGGWGYSPEDACRILAPQGTGKTLLGAHAASAQELVVYLRLSLECDRAGLVPAHISPLSRVIHLGPQDSVYEALEVELLALPKERRAELEALNADASLPEADRLRRIREMSSRVVREFWFDTTDIRDHNAGVLYNAAFKPRAVSARGISASRLVKAPDVLQRSIYLAVSPKGFLAAVPDAGIAPALVDGGWGYDQASALVQRLPAGTAGRFGEFIPQQMELVSIRNLLEFSQPTPAGERLQPVDHDKRGQALVTPENGRVYDRLTVDVYLVPSEAYASRALPLMRDGSPEAKAALRAMSRKVEREFWFDITEPFQHNAGILEKEITANSPAGK